MDVSIIGAGAVGLALAESLSRRGVVVEVVVRKERERDLKQRGLWAKRIGCSIQPIRAEIVTAPTTRTLLMTPKTYALPQALQMYAKGQETVVAFQNGLTADAVVKKYAPQADDYGAVVSFTANSLKAGEVEILAAENDRLAIGLGCEQDEKNLTVRQSEVYALLARGLDVRPVKTLSGARWAKLIVNLNNALLAATNLPARRLFAHPYGPWLALTVMREGLAVAKASHVKLAKIPWASPVLMRFVAMLPDALALALVRRQAEKVMSQEMDTLGSTLQSLRRGEPTEIDELNGAIVRLGRPLSVPTPLNAALAYAVNAQSRGGAPTTIDALIQAALSDEPLPTAA
jgi:2-dehydropantoate 2-reductase